MNGEMRCNVIERDQPMLVAWLGAGVGCIL
jgi:hypothetical protein